MSSLKPRIIRKKNRTTVKHVPKTDPKQQRVLKSLFVARSSSTKKRSSGAIRRPSAPLPSQQVWRRTAVRNMPKPKPKVKLPRLFRVDNMTGLPVDYERNVERVMHYVNPHLASRPNAEQALEELMTKMFMQMVCQGSRDQREPEHKCCLDHNAKRSLQAMLKAYSCQTGQFPKKIKMDGQINQKKREANEDLSDFHMACKRGPRPMSTNLGPTQANKFNFNKLKIKSH